jgi:hypothetical protein
MVPFIYLIGLILIPAYWTARAPEWARPFCHKVHMGVLVGCTVTHPILMHLFGKA